METLDRIERVERIDRLSSDSDFRKNYGVVHKYGIAFHGKHCIVARKECRSEDLAQDRRLTCCPTQPLAVKQATVPSDCLARCA